MSRALRQTAQPLTQFDRALINSMQGDFPLESSPFDALAEVLNCTPEDVMVGVQSLLDRGIVTRLGPLFNIESMGGVFSLCALKVPAARFESVVSLVNSYTQVAHNYERQHEWNMWYVLAAETQAELEATFHEITERSGGPGLNLPKEREFYVGLQLTA